MAPSSDGTGHWTMQWRVHDTEQTRDFLFPDICGNSCDYVHSKEHWKQRNFCISRWIFQFPTCFKWSIAAGLPYLMSPVQISSKICQEMYTESSYVMANRQFRTSVSVRCMIKAVYPGTKVITAHSTQAHLPLWRGKKQNIYKFKDPTAYI